MTEQKLTETEVAETCEAMGVKSTKTKCALLCKNGKHPCLYPTGKISTPEAPSFPYCKDANCKYLKDTYPIGSALQEALEAALEKKGCGWHLSAFPGSAAGFHYTILAPDYTTPVGKAYAPIKLDALLGACREYVRKGE